MKLKPYPEYKDSGLLWIGRIPTHWELPRLGAVLRERGETNDDGRVSDVLSVLRERGVIPYAEKGNIGNKKSEDITRYKVVRPDDIVVNCMNVIIGSVGLSRYTGCLSPVYYVLTRRSKDDDPRYLNAYFQAKPFQESLVRIGNGILAHRMRIPMELLKCEPFPRPPSQEQSAIVRFLDHFDQRINRLIRAKQKLITLLNEQKQAIIHRAVTRGLDPDVRLKPSGVEWLGEVPEHWRVSRLKFEASHIVDCLHATPEYVLDGPYPAIRTADIEPGKIRLQNAKRVSSEQYTLWTSRLVPRAGDILYSREGERFGIAALVPADVKLCISQRMMIFRIRPLLNSEFVMWQLNCPHVYAQASADIIGATSPHVNVEKIKNFEIVLPPLEEQRKIILWIGEQNRSVDALIGRARNEISLLREYRTRLIADVATGKLDVRGVELPELDEAGVLEELDGEVAAEDMNSDAENDGEDMAEEVGRA